jgi:hypothetical protein
MVMDVILSVWLLFMLWRTELTEKCSETGVRENKLKTGIAISVLINYYFIVI